MIRPEVSGKVTDEAFGPALRRLRREQGLSLRKLQTLVRYDFTYLGQVERGEKPGSAELAAACDAALNTAGDLALVYLRTSAASIVGLQSADDQTAADHVEQIDHLEREAADLQTAYHAAPSPDGLLDLTRGHLESVTELLRSDVPDGEKPRLQQDRSVIAALGGRLGFFDLDDPLTARAYFTVSYEAAIQATDDALAAVALGHLAFPPAKEGDSSAAVAYLGDAVTHARRAGVPVVSSWLSAVESEVLCEVDPTAALRALDHAELSLGHAEDDETPAWFDYYSPARLEGFRGHALLTGGHPEQARMALGDALAGVEHRAVKQRALIRTDIAATWLVTTRRDVDRACELATESAAELAAAGYATAVERLRRLRGRLTPWERSRAVRQLDEALAVLPDFRVPPDLDVLAGP
jgi:transcriptional regulator with XRE-family HTH domain